MYEQYYHLSGMPFQLTPDTRYFFGSKGHSRAISHLIYGLSQGEGFIVITGEVGAGKTTLVRNGCGRKIGGGHLHRRGPASVNTQVSNSDLFTSAPWRASAFGLPYDQPRPSAIAADAGWRAFLRDHADRQGKRRCLLVVDEAQNLLARKRWRNCACCRIFRPPTNGGAAMQTFLLGQPAIPQDPARRSPDARPIAPARASPPIIWVRWMRPRRSQAICGTPPGHRAGWNGDPAFSPESSFAAIHTLLGRHPAQASIPAVRRACCCMAFPGRAASVYRRPGQGSSGRWSRKNSHVPASEMISTSSFKVMPKATGTPAMGNLPWPVRQRHGSHGRKAVTKIERSRGHEVLDVLKRLGLALPRPIGPAGPSTAPGACSMQAVLKSCSGGLSLTDPQCDDRSMWKTISRSQAFANVDFARQRGPSRECRVEANMDLHPRPSSARAKRQGHLLHAGLAGRTVSRHGRAQHRRRRP